jgi:hypothetical protein
MEGISTLSLNSQIQGDIYSHCWFYESARRSFEYEGYGDTCGGITGIALTAFMLESYLNLCCKRIFDVESRVTEILDDSPSEIFNVIDRITSEGMHINEKLSLAYGFKGQLDSLKKALESTLDDIRRRKFIRLSVDKSFYEIDDKLRFSPKAKFFALSETLYDEDNLKKQHRDIVEELFNLRNSLAHGRSEFVQNSFSVTSPEILRMTPDLIPMLQAGWQEKCSLVNAKKAFSHSCEIILLLSSKAFKEEDPFRMPTQIGLITQG